jgi:cholesterol transport system auxiliary component
MPLLGFGAALGLMLASGCGSMVPKGSPPPLVYVLDGASGTRLPTPRGAAPDLAPVLIVNQTRAAPGFDSPHIVYVRVPHQVEHFAHSDWVDTPARMLTPLIVSALASASDFRVVVTASSDIAGELRLDTEVLRLQQEFGGGPSRVRFTLRATLRDNVSRQLISWREFDETVASDSESPYGGVIAANQAVQHVMAQLAAYCTQAAGPWQAARGTPSPRPHPPP